MWNLVWRSCKALYWSKVKLSFSPCAASWQGHLWGVEVHPYTFFDTEWTWAVTWVLRTEFTAVNVQGATEGFIASMGTVKNRYMFAPVENWILISRLFNFYPSELSLIIPIWNKMKFILQLLISTLTSTEFNKIQSVVMEMKHTDNKIYKVFLFCGIGTSKFYCYIKKLCRRQCWVKDE